MEQVSEALRAYAEVIDSERRLVRLGHILWYMKKKSLKSNDAYAVNGFNVALECIWEIKRQVRKELKAATVLESQRVRARLGRKKAGESTEQALLAA